MSKISIDSNRLWDIGKAFELIQNNVSELSARLKSKANSLNIFEDMLQWTDERIKSEAGQMSKQGERCGKAASYLFKMAESYEAAENTVKSALGAVALAMNSVREGNDKINAQFKEWLPPVMQLDGTSPEEVYLREQLDKNNKTNENWKTKWDQDKVNAVWESCEIIYDQYGIQIDPRLLIAIIFQEGTGSFNTSATNKAADGQNGYEKDAAKDLMRANSLVFGKILGYIQYGEEFNRVVAATDNCRGISGSGSFFQYLNWETPILKPDGGKPYAGVYAGHSEWYKGVESFYGELTGSDTAAAEYSEYLMSQDKTIVSENASSVPDYSFEVLQNGQDSEGYLDGSYTVTAKRR